MTIASFDDLLQAARQQSEPQRLLFVFANAERPQEGTPEQHARFEAGQGGALAPLMCVDKTPQELDSFEALVEESRQLGEDWAIVFVAAMSGRDGRPPTSKEAETPLQRMVEAVKTGSVGSYIPFDRHGEPVQIE